MIDLSIVIVNWNVCDLLRRCLRSIFDSAVADQEIPSVWRYKSPAQRLAAFRFEVLVVDSASSDDSVDMVRREFPGVRLYASDTNLGYTGGNNLGMRESHGRHMLVLNPDTEVWGDALSAMIAYLDAHPRVGVVGPQLLWPDGSVQSSRRRFPTLGTAFVESTFLQKWFPRHPALRRYYALDLPDDVTNEVDWVQGACLMVRREAIEQVGLLDDAYFMYSEELDWQRRISGAGWKVVYLPMAQIVHHEGKSSEQAVAARHVNFQTSKVRYFRKYHGVAAAEVLRAFLLGTYVWQLGLEAAKWLVGHKRALRAQRVTAYLQVLRSRLL
jgi:N-acetylglucosaminyl-diphospho-decaprenol L-rhamnosyltransferase